MEYPKLPHAQQLFPQPTPSTQPTSEASSASPQDTSQTTKRRADCNRLSCIGHRGLSQQNSVDVCQLGDCNMRGGSVGVLPQNERENHWAVCCQQQIIGARYRECAQSVGNV
mmetsp:Transcript_35716/g.68989  ORF Transcript_35716/g.68989 Transcript_35716/m.68989 type:complete len:112 (-) Transcript_35716:54-389(-)